MITVLSHKTKNTSHEKSENKNVAIKLISGHIKHTVKAEIINVINIG